MRTGQTIAAKYRLNRQLGAGGMASVWSATNVFTERDFAIKFMLPAVARTPEAAQRFLLEAKVSARINHPNIIEVIDVGQAEDGSLFLVMELLTGVSLEVAIRRQRPSMSVHELMTHMREVAIALAAAHRKGVIHRDLKPTNIFLHQDRDGRVVPKILDFGVSKILEEKQNTALTIEGTVLGSPHYMSPEQAMGATGLDGRTDVFAFGGILFEALVGQRAYDAPNFNALIVTIATQEPKNIDEFAPHVPESLRSLVRDCLITDRQARPASFEPIIERITALLPEVDRPDLRLPGVASIEPQVTMQVATLPPASARPTDATLAGLQAFGTFMRTLPPRALMLAGALLVLLAAGIVTTFTRRSDSALPSSPPATLAPVAAAPAPPEPQPRATANAVPAAPPSATGNGLPVVSVDSLPVATRRASRSTGRLSVSASPGWCSISVDGVARGVTPVSSFELSAGTHRIDCVPPVGKPQIATVTVSEGTVAHHTFPLEP
ncbi:MAG: serine/threonine protein kinase [Myxococcales bacterium]|nr:serine/threonine protein kinase [Myxococcales bacterium]